MPSCKMFDFAHYQTESAASLRTSHDKLQSLQKQNVELARKLKEVEKQLAVLGSVASSLPILARCLMPQG